MKSTTLVEFALFALPLNSLRHLMLDGCSWKSVIILQSSLPRRGASVSCESRFVLVTALPSMWPCLLSRNSVWPHGLYSPWNSLGQNTGVGSLFLLQGIFPTQGSNPGLPHCRRILYQLSHKRSPRILEWVAYLFSSRAFWLRNRTGVSCIARGFFNIWNSFKAIKEGERPLSSKLQVTFSGHQNFLTSD